MFWFWTCFFVTVVKFVFLLTFIYSVDVLLFRQDSGQTLHQQQCLLVALQRSGAAVKHLIQRCSLHLSTPALLVSAGSEPRSGRSVRRPLTMCTAWLYSSFSAVSPLKRSISFCLSSRKVCRPRLREWHCVTQVLYCSFSFRITAPRKHSMQTFTSHPEPPLVSFSALFHSRHFTNTSNGCTVTKRGVTPFDCVWGQKLATGNVVFGSVQGCWQELFGLHAQHQLLRKAGT